MLRFFSSNAINSHCDRIHTSLTAVHCFHSGYVGKQAVARKEYCAEYWCQRTRGKHGEVHWPLQYNSNNVEKGFKHDTINQSIKIDWVQTVGDVNNPCKFHKTQTAITDFIAYTKQN